MSILDDMELYMYDRRDAKGTCMAWLGYIVGCMFEIVTGWLELLR